MKKRLPIIGLVFSCLLGMLSAITSPEERALQLAVRCQERYDTLGTQVEGAMDFLDTFLALTSMEQNAVVGSFFHRIILTSTQMDFEALFEGNSDMLDSIRSFVFTLQRISYNRFYSMYEDTGLTLDTLLKSSGAVPNIIYRFIKDDMYRAQSRGETTRTPEVLCIRGAHEPQ